MVENIEHCWIFFARGVTTIYAGTGCAIFWGAFFRAENKFWGIIFGKITSIHKFWDVILEKYLIRVLILIKFHLLGELS